MAGLTLPSLRDAVGRVSWEGQRVRREASHRLGIPGLMAALAVTFMLGALWVREVQQARWIDARDVAASRPLALPPEPAALAADARSRLRAFEDHLLAHEEIPVALQNLIALAQANGLVLARGAYRPQSETQGGYLRYRMTLPVTGRADAILRFAMAALKANPTMSLENVQFKRERGDEETVEARIQWALLTRLPPAARPPSAGHAP